jgi:hypothetical protein
MTRGATTRRGALVLAATALLAGCGEGEPERDQAGTITTAADTRLLNLRAGDCVSNFRDRLEHPDGGHNGVPKVTAVKCSASHDAEVLLVQKLDEAGEKWPGYTIVNGEGARGRQQLQPRLQRIKRADGQVTVVAFRPSDDRWVYEDQYSIYYLALYAKPQTGSAPE